MAVTVFILGRPGSGKSAAAHRITKLAQRKDWASTHICDYVILHKWFLSEKHNSLIKYRYFRPTEHNGFDVIDFSILRKALEEVERRVQKHLSSKKKLILIEFARGDYSEVLRTFSNEVLHNAYFLFLDSDIDTCIQRVRARTSHPTTVHDHYVSEKIFRSYYHKDNKSYILSQFAKDYDLDNRRVKVIDNAGSWDDFMRQIKEFTDALFVEQELSISRESSNSLEVLSKQESGKRRKTGPLSGAFPSLGAPTCCPNSIKS